MGVEEVSHCENSILSKEDTPDSSISTLSVSLSDGDNVSSFDGASGMDGGNAACVGRATVTPALMKADQSSDMKEGPIGIKMQLSGDAIKLLKDGEGKQGKKLDKKDVEEEEDEQVEENEEIKLMKAEELMAEEKNKVEEEKLVEEILVRQQEEKHLQEQRHKRLMHLLTKSQFYSQFLLEKIKSQMKEEDECTSISTTEHKDTLLSDGGESSSGPKSMEGCGKRKTRSPSLSSRAQKKPKTDSLHQVAELNKQVSSKLLDSQCRVLQKI
ncbi:hypothetical protein FHG87_024485 [Trinorchestia longiramus]|nr:hypothetical protein FHG87_024485 [Trinorchestia longiramus]